MFKQVGFVMYILADTQQHGMYLLNVLGEMRIS